MGVTDYADEGTAIAASAQLCRWQPQLWGEGSLRELASPSADGHRNDTSAWASDQRATAGRTPLRILWIDDEIRSDDALVRLLEHEGFRIAVAGTGAEGLRLAAAGSCDAVILDLRLPDMFGLTVLERIVAANMNVPVLVATGHYLEAEVEAHARRLGATAFRHKPFIDSDELVGLIRSIAARSGSLALNSSGVPSKDASAPALVAASPAMQAIVAWIERVGPMPSTVLLTGETGTGKELVARALHLASPRRAGPYLPVNCAAIAPSLVETELFGHRKGAFTGATSDKEGVIEAAHGGTLFLDEIGDLPPAMQGSLLRFLENHELRRVGDTKTRRVDVRVIAATNHSLREDAGRGRFREDLYYRLAVAYTHIPPLRERLEDLEPLVTYWLARMTEHGRKGVRGITPGALEVMRAHRWPGNVRELRNVLERIVGIASGDLVTERDVAAAMCDAPAATVTAIADLDASEEQRRTLAALEVHHWNRAETARHLGISRNTLWRRLRRWGFGSGPQRG
jgi:DNA-binding NtrC family response regulator